MQKQKNDFIYEINLIGSKPTEIEQLHSYILPIYLNYKEYKNCKWYQFKKKKNTLTNMFSFIYIMNEEFNRIYNNNNKKNKT